MTTQYLPLDRILTDAGTQMRIENDEATIAEYAEALQQGCEFPPIIVFTDGVSYWLADGFHRFLAHLRCCLETILCEIRQGTLNDAKKYACEANTKHGLRRTNGHWPRNNRYNISHFWRKTLWYSMLTSTNASAPNA